MIHDLRMAWAFFRSLRKWRRRGIGVIAVEVCTDAHTGPRAPCLDRRDAAAGLEVPDEAL
jgi:hypothetical protein